jgi:hypothetical protein
MYANGPGTAEQLAGRHYKGNASSGSPHSFILPDGCADRLFAAETTMPAVSYLNHPFSHGGFPARPSRTTSGTSIHMARPGPATVPHGHTPL